MKVSGTNLSMVRGDDETITVTIEDYNLQDGDVISFAVKEDAESEDYLIHKQITSFDDGVAYININHDDTAKLDFGSYVYDVQIKFREVNKIRTLVEKSKFKLTEEVATDG